MTDSEQIDLCELLNRCRSLCYKLAEVEQEIDDGFGIEFCGIAPGADYRVEMHVYRGIEKILEAAGCKGTVTDFLDGKKWVRAIYGGDTRVLQISDEDGNFEKAKEKDNGI